ncbi:MAG: ABC transporter ATP-binding protein [Eubacterium sp.]|nr:ABC transporter ATP-binding protein [Eubacterium sp.]
MNAIEITGLSKSYNDFTLDNINLTLPSGCILGLVGENGAGKSTTIKLMLNMIKKNNGEIKLLGKDYTVCSKEDIGVVFDESHFPECLNVKEINKILKNIYHQWSEQEFFNFCNKLRLPLSKKVKDFSRGMKMKLSIAAALSHNAKLLILDEPTSGLDPVVRDEILDIFYDFTRDENHSILISSHIVSDLEKLCDYIAFMHKGKLILCEEKDELLNDYCIVQCSEKVFSGIYKSDVLGMRKTDFAVNAVIKKSAVTSDMNAAAIALEDLFVYMIRRGQE